MIDCSSALNTKYFENVSSRYFQDYFIEDNNINIDKAIEVIGNVDIKGDVNLNTAIKAIKNVNIKSSCINANNSVIYSTNGNIKFSGKNLNFNGLLYAPNGTIELRGDNLSLNNILIIAQKIIIDAEVVNINYNETFAKIIGNAPYLEELPKERFTAFGEYIAEDRNIIIEWNQNKENYYIFESEDNKKYDYVDQVSNVDQYTYATEKEFDKKYFKVAYLAQDGKYVESVPFLVTNDSNGYEVKWIDTDDDGLEDVYEVFFETDTDKKDTDDDGLSDYEEIYMTLSDANVDDSIENGILDADADSDEDNLSNIKELELHTDPIEADTDGDNISDGKEMQNGTDPLKVDTDGDGLEDDDEEILQVNPLLKDSNENGIEDGEEYYKQVVDECNIKSDVFEDNDAIPQEIILEAKGNVNKTIEISEYNGSLKGEERDYVGKVIEMSNADIRSGKISFRIDEEYEIENYSTVMGMTNALLICYNDGEETTPLETDYNINSRIISADISGDGIYFILNVSEWLDSMGLELPTEDSPYVVKKDNTSVSQAKVSSKSISTFAKDVSIGGKKVNKQADIVFVIDTTGSMQGPIDDVKDKLSKFIDDLKKLSISPSFAIVDFRDIEYDKDHPTAIVKNGKSNWFRSAKKAKKAIAKLSVAGGEDLKETPIDGLEMAHRLDFRKSAEKYIILITDDGYKVSNNYKIKSMEELAESLEKDDISVSVVTAEKFETTYKPLYNKTGGIYANIYRIFNNELLKIANNL